MTIECTEPAECLWIWGLQEAYRKSAAVFKGCVETEGSKKGA